LSAPYFPLPNWQKLDWSLSQINLNQSFTGSVIYDLPFGKGKMFGSDWNPVTNALLGGWQVTLIERISSGFPVPLIDSSNHIGHTFNTGGNDYNYNRPNQVSNCNPLSRQSRQVPVDQPGLFRRTACWRTRQRPTRPRHRTRFCQHRLLRHQAVRVASERNRTELPRRVLQPGESSPVRRADCRHQTIRASCNWPSSYRSEVRRCMSANAPCPIHSVS
jgi:hypothetical protein